MYESPATVVAANLRRLRIARALSVAELGRRAGVARATLTQLEAGSGNPTLETLYALANQLGAPLADLIAAPPAAPALRIVRKGEGPRATGTAVDAWLLDQQVTVDARTEIYSIVLDRAVEQRSDAHPPGTREHVHVHAGRIRIGPADAPVELRAGDYADYPADLPHVYQRLGRPTATATLIIVSAG